jgi:two-component sensor histidine kinase
MSLEAMSLEAPSPRLEQLFPGDSEMAYRMRAMNWSATPLGQPEAWPRDVQVAVRLCLTSGIAIVLFLGPELTMLYNDPYIPFLGETKHPRDLARPARDCWSEIWDTVGPMAASVYATGHATSPSDFQMFFRRRVPREEVYVRFTYGPIFGADGRSVAGIFCPCTETTEQVVGARHLETLRRLGIGSGEARTVDAACAKAVAVLGENRHDIPFAAIYAVDSTGSAATLSATAHPGSQHHLPESVSAGDDDLRSPWPIAAVLRTQRRVECEDLPAAGIRISGAWPEPTEGAILLPIEGTKDRLAAILVAGLSPRRPLDTAYRTFLDLIARHVGQAISDGRAYEAEHERAEKLESAGMKPTGHPEPLPGAEAEVEATGEPDPSEHILVVDDDADMRDYLVRLLRPRWVVQAVADGEAALAAIRHSRPDLVLSDVLMPILDGFGLLKALRSDPALESIPVIMLSARAGEESRVEGLKTGADDYLIKPFSAAEVLIRVELHLKKARVDAALRVSLAQQQALMKEVHHRVKNNLEVVNSLLMLQSGFVVDAKLKSVLVETANRVRVIADIHRLLYAAPKLDQVDLAAFVERLADSLFAVYSSAGARVHLDLHAVAGSMDLQRAVPLGLILNELFCNALKHAFPGNRHGNILLRVDEAGLEFSDDGVGFPASVDPKNSPSLGLQLVKILVDQIGGTLSIQSGPGTRFTVKFS